MCDRPGGSSRLVAAPHYPHRVPRVRFGVVLLVPAAVADQVDGLRRAFGDPALGRVPPHVTLVPPVNVRADDVAATLRVLREAASASRPLTMVLGPPRTFEGDEGVVYLAVRGAEADEASLRRLHEALRSGPLERPLDHPFVPHVTVATGVAPERIASRLDSAAGFCDVEVVFDRVHLLQQQAEPPHRWLPVADVALQPAIVVGRGGLPVELTPAELVDSEALDVLAEARGPDRDDVPEGARALVVVARRDHAPVGLAEGWTAGPVAELVAVRTLDPTDGTDDHLRAAWWSAAADRGAS